MKITWPGLPRAGADGATRPTFGDWIYQCAEVADGKAACSLNQTLVDQQSGRSVLKYSLGRDPASGKMTLVALLPLGLDFAVGVSGAVDERASFQYGLRTCIGTTCIAIAEVDAGRLVQLRAGTQLKIGWMLGEAEPRVLAGSLDGITRPAHWQLVSKQHAYGRAAECGGAVNSSPTHPRTGTNSVSNFVTQSRVH